MTTRKQAFRSAAVILAVTSALTMAQAADHGSDAGTRANTWANTNPYIVQSASTPEARKDVAHVGAKVRQDLPIIHGVIADLDEEQAAQLRLIPDAHVFKDQPVETRGAAPPPPPPPPNTSVIDWSSIVFTDGTAVVGAPESSGYELSVLGGSGSRTSAGNHREGDNHCDPRYRDMDWGRRRISGPGAG